MPDIDFAHAARRIAERCPGMRARQASRMLSRLYDDALRPLGVQGSQLSLLVAVAMFGEGGATLGPLAQALAMDRTTLTRNVRPLERSGLLRVARSPEDARARIVLLTRAGERLLEAAYPVWERVTMRITEAVGRGNMAALHAQLDSIVQQTRQL